MNRICFFFVASLTLLFFIPGVSHAENEQEEAKHVLVLHSFFQGFEWSDNIIDGLQSGFETSPEHIELYHQYLEFRRNSGTPYRLALTELLRVKSKKNRIDLIIVTDAEALEFVNQHAKEFYPGVPVVFCAINNIDERNSGNIEQITGVLETVEDVATIERMISFHPAAKKLIVVDPYGRKIKSIVEHYLEIEAHFKGRIEFEYYTDYVQEGRVSELLNLGLEYLAYIPIAITENNNIFINYDKDGKVINPEINFPVYSSWKPLLGKGIVGGVINAGFEQGRNAAELAIGVLKGKEASSFPYISNPVQYASYDLNVLKRFGISTVLLNSDDVIINQEDTTGEWLQMAAIGICLFLLCFITILMWRFLAHKRDLEHLTDVKYLSEHAKETINRQLETALNFTPDTIDKLPVPIFYKDTAGIYLYCNHAFAEWILGLAPADVIGNTFYGLLEHFPHLQSEQEKTLYFRLLNNHYDDRFHEHEVVCIDGLTRVFRVMSHTVVDPEHEISGVVGMMLDISQYVHLQKEREELTLKLQKQIELGNLSQTSV